MSKLVRRTRPFRMWALRFCVRPLCVHTCGDLQTRVCAWCVSANSCLRLGRWANSLVLQRPFIFIMGRHVDGSGRIWRFYYVIFLFGRFIGILWCSWIFALFRAEILFGLLAITYNFRHIKFIQSLNWDDKLILYFLFDIC